MTGARLRSTRSARPCAGQGLAHSPRTGATLAAVSGVDDRPLIPNRRSEQRMQTECAGHLGDRRQQGSSPVRAATLVAGSEASRARPEGVASKPIALRLSKLESRHLQNSLERQLKAIRSSLSFWQHETAMTGQNPPFDMASKLYEAQLIQRLYLELFDINKAMKLNETAYKKAKYQEQ